MQLPAAKRMLPAAQTKAGKLSAVMASLRARVACVVSLGQPVNMLAMTAAARREGDGERGAGRRAWQNAKAGAQQRAALWRKLWLTGAASYAKGMHSTLCGEPACWQAPPLRARGGWLT